MLQLCFFGNAGWSFAIYEQAVSHGVVCYRPDAYADPGHLALQWTLIGGMVFRSTKIVDDKLLIW